MHHRLHLYLHFFILFGYLTFSSAHAQTVTLQVSPKLTANAEFLKGDAKTAVLIVHGFMTTNQFLTVQTLMTTLHDEDYSVLAPNLTLGISNRKQSLKCNSLHTHTLEQDALEISKWVSWLQQQGFQKIILLGHSSGSQEILLSQFKHPNPAVKGLFLTSLFYFNGPELGTRTQDIAFAKKHLHDPLPPIHKYSFLFCKNNYTATPQSYLSYQKINRQFNLNLLKKIKIPTVIFMGGNDKRYQNVGRNWLTELKNTGKTVIIIPKANHFFSSEGEFELQDKLIQAIHDAGF